MCRFSLGICTGKQCVAESQEAVDVRREAGAEASQSKRGLVGAEFPQGGKVQRRGENVSEAGGLQEVARKIMFPTPAAPSGALQP